MNILLLFEQLSLLKLVQGSELINISDLAYKKTDHLTSTNLIKYLEYFLAFPYFIS